MAASSRLAPLTEDDLWERIGVLEEMLKVAEERQWERAVEHLRQYVIETKARLDSMRAERSAVET